jgi:hypothetical protein
MTVTASPTLAISMVVRPEGPNAIALGAVDTGSMKAKEHTCDQEEMVTSSDAREPGSYNKTLLRNWQRPN